LPEIVEPIARAVESDRVSALARVLARFGATGAFADETLFAPPSDARYSRYPLWRDPKGRFAIVCMTWLPGQGTPVHDHAGRWGAELVVRGAMCETSYKVVERAQDGRSRLEHAAETAMKPSDISVVLPTVDVHAFHNVGSVVAHTVHVYSSLNDACTTFTPNDAEWWTPGRVELRYDA
jgi:predicted metal-dependent enzyme (double-stranded beta helix superfamily)